MTVASRPNFEGQIVAERRVEMLLFKVTKALDEAGIAYAVIGGNAVAAWVMTVDEGAVRATRDVDLLVHRRDLDVLAAALEPAGLMRLEVLGVSMFVDRQRPNPKTGVHLVFSGERIRAHYQHAAPGLDAAVRGRSGYRVIDLPALVAMKLQAFRDIDRVHIRDMLSVGLIDEATINALPEDLRDRLDEIRSREE